jgi:sugar phosphate isomerase/epimerase
MKTRRSLIQSTLQCLSATALTGLAIEPIQRAGKSHMALGVAAYSFGKYFQFMRDKEQKPMEGRKPWSILDFIDWCADNNVPGAELTSYFFPPDADEAYCLKVRHHAYLRGVQICGTAVGNTFTHPEGPDRDKEITYVKRWIDLAAAMGAPHIRVFAGSKQKGQSDADALALCQSAYAECLKYAEKKGIFLGLENHGGIVAEPDALVALVRQADSPWAGINFDSGNFHTEDPYADLAKIAPYSVNVQLKMDISRKGAAKGQHEESDVPRVLKILRDANYQGWFTLEYERKDQDPFVEIPKILAQLRPLLAGL